MSNIKTSSPGMHFNRIFVGAGSENGNRAWTTPHRRWVCLRLHEYLENEKANDDRLDEKEDGVELMIPLVSRDRGCR
jgi:hypothetical protein